MLRTGLKRSETSHLNVRIARTVSVDKVTYRDTYMSTATCYFVPVSEYLTDKVDCMHDNFIVVGRNSHST